MPSISHLGIACTSDSKIALSKVFSILGIELTHSETVASQRVTTQFFELSQSSCNLELLDPTDPESPIAKFLTKHGPGIHHFAIGLEPGTLIQKSAELKAAGVRLVYDTPQPAAHGCRMNFIHPASGGGILIELIEPHS